MSISDEQKASVIARLNRMEGQIRGIRKMLEEGRRCDDVLSQVAAVRGAINSLSVRIAESFIRGCVTTRAGNSIDDGTVAEIVGLFRKFQN